MEDVPDHKRQLGTPFMLATRTCIQDTHVELLHRTSKHCVSHLQPRHRHWVYSSTSYMLEYAASNRRRNFP